jgi:hypothetical protein
MCVADGTFLLFPVKFPLMPRSVFNFYVCAALLFAGCAGSRNGETVPRTTTPPAPVAIGQAAAVSPSLPTCEYALLIDSDPAGGTVVVNGVPVGKTPQRVTLPGTVHGFFREQVSLKVRFVAADTEHASQTVEELMTPLDRIPASMHFTLGGANRMTR